MKNFTKFALLLVAVVVMTGSSWAFTGKVAIIADGNSPDPDDISGTSASIAMLKIFGAENQLVHYSHSCDLSGMEDREEMMRRSLFETAAAWGGFDTSNFFNFDNQRDAASTHLANRINEASSGNLLYIVNAGETDLLYEAMAKATQWKRQYVRYITHHVANDVGDFHDLTDILAIAGTPAESTFVLRIHDQNDNLRRDISEMYWTRDHGDPKVNIMWEFAELMESEHDDFPYLENKADISDAGMLWYLLTNFTDQDCSFAKFEQKVNDYIPGIKAYITSPSNNSSFNIGQSITLKANASTGSGSIAKVNFRIDGGYYKQDTSFPYETTWTPSQAGTYTLDLSVYDNNNVRYISQDVIVTVSDGGDISATYKFKNVATGNYMDSDGSVAKAKTYTGNTDQRWRVIKTVDDKYNIDSDFSGRGVLRADGGSLITGISTEPITTADNCEWTLEDLGNDTYRFKNVSTNTYLAENTSTHVIEATGWNGDRAKWVLEYYGPKSASLFDVEMQSENKINGIVIFPNPASSSFTIDLGNEKDATVEIFNTSGQLIYSQQAVNNRLFITAGSEFKPGLYLINVNSNENQYQKKLIIK